MVWFIKIVPVGKGVQLVLDQKKDLEDLGFNLSNTTEHMLANQWGSALQVFSLFKWE